MGSKGPHRTGPLGHGPKSTRKQNSEHIFGQNFCEILVKILLASSWAEEHPQGRMNPCSSLGEGESLAKMTIAATSQNLSLDYPSVWGGKWLEKCVFWGEGDAPAKVTIR